MFKKIIKKLNNEKFNNTINYLFIFPMLYLIQHSWENFQIIALLLATFILFKNLLLIKIRKINNKDNFTWLIKILQIFKTILIVSLFCLQYKYKSFTKYNIWISGFFYLKLIIMYIKKKFYYCVIHKIRKMRK